MPDTMQRLGILDIPMTIAEQQLLYGLTRDPGYPVLIRVLKAAAMKTTEEGIKTNTTDKDMIFSINGGVTDNFVVPSGQSLSCDASANGVQNNEYLPQGTQFAVKQVSAPSSGSVYVAGMYT